VAAVYFLLPLWAALRFAGVGAFGSVISEPGFTSSLALSVRLAVITTLVTIALMLPTTVYVHLRLPKLRRLLEGITILPIVIPPVVLIVGVLAIAPGFLKSTSLLLGRGHGVPELQPVPEHVGARQRGLRAPDAQDGRGPAAPAGRRPAGSTVPLRRHRPDETEVDVLVRPEGLTMEVAENGNGIVTTRTFLGSVTRVGVQLSGDVAVQVDRPSAESAALAPGASVAVSLPGQPVLVALRQVS
jgi:TOBE domain